jgi:DNA polymerase-4
VILHSDLNNFYASVECLYNPDIRNKPVAVCGSQSTRHGIVLAKNYIAKKYNIKTGEPIWEAKKKCPNLVIVRPNYILYLKFSKLAIDIYKRYTDLIEPFGIDECWLDVTNSVRLFGDGVDIAYKIKEEIKEELGVTASVGVSYNKIFAKLGSDMKKPDAVTEITEENFKDIVWPLPVNNLMYVGHSTKVKLNRAGILSIGDLARTTPSFLIRQLGKWGEMLWVFANGYDDNAVTRAGHEPIIKGIGNSLTTPRDLICNEDVKILFYVLADSVAQRLRRHNLKGKTIQITIRDSDMGTIDRQGQLPYYTSISTEIAEKALEIFLKSWDWSKNIRLLGVRVSKLITADSYIQLSFFEDDTRTKKQLLESGIDKIRARYGHYSVQRALLLKDSSLNGNPAEENVIHPVPYFRQGGIL